MPQVHWTWIALSWVPQACCIDELLTASWTLVASAIVQHLVVVILCQSSCSEGDPCIATPITNFCRATLCKTRSSCSRRLGAWNSLSVDVSCAYTTKSFNQNLKTVVLCKSTTALLRLELLQFHLTSTTIDTSRFIQGYSSSWFIRSRKCTHACCRVIRCSFYRGCDWCSALIVSRCLMMTMQRMWPGLYR